MSDKLKTMDSRTIEHQNSQTLDLARRSSVPKRANGPAPIHSSMASRPDTSIGAPPRDANPPDASSPLPTDPTKQHGSKAFPIPSVSWGSKSDPERGLYDPGSGPAVMSEAKRDVTDYAKDLHAVLPQKVGEN